jgi:RNA polymerase sigma-70 factor (ECF subfamily)
MDRSRAEFERRVLPLELDLYAGALALAGQEADALDLVQETLLRAFRSFASFDRGENLKAWLFTILRNAFLDRCRRKRLEPEALAPGTPLPAAPGPEPPPSLEDALPDELLASLRSLSPSHQLLLLLCDIEGLRYREIAGVLDWPIGSVMSGLHNARTRLREALLKRRERSAVR